MSISALEPVHPDHDDVVAADAALNRVTSYLSTHPAGPGMVRVTVAEDAGELLLPLTTQQAADLLNVSRPYLIGLLDAEEIEYRKVGKHRRVKAASLLEYMRNDDQRRRAAADELSALTQEMGLAE